MGKSEEEEEEEEEEENQNYTIPKKKDIYVRAWARRGGGEHLHNV
jgi:hypothetical protein